MSATKGGAFTENELFDEESYETDPVPLNISFKYNVEKTNDTSTPQYSLESIM